MITPDVGENGIEFLLEEDLFLTGVQEIYIRHYVILLFNSSAASVNFLGLWK